LYFKLKTSEEVFEILKTFPPVKEETISLGDGLGRVLSRTVTSPEDLPGFKRSSMDGYAVRAKDTFGATESLPVLLEIGGEVIMGQIPTVKTEPGKAVKISTGGMLPDGGDGVVMVEYCHALDDRTIEVSRSISPLENVIREDDDFKKGETVFEKGHVLRPQDVGLLAGLGISEISVYGRPKVAVISTGDEVVPVDQRPRPGQVRDINSYTLSAFCRQAGAAPMVLGLCGDSFEGLREKVAQGLEKADTLWISGGSSVGTRDHTLRVFESFEESEILVHGISISPGKPTIIARMGSRAVFGLPGHTASAMVVAEVFLTAFLSGLSGKQGSEGALHRTANAELGRNIESASGREDYIRVKLEKKGDKWVAEPVFGKSGLISTLVDADGLVRVDRNTEGLYQGQPVKVMLFASFVGERP
jgi:molybdopterin molybdotransferase